MLKNDYRRDMILMRPLEDGISGFCRVEARLSRGSITYTVRAQRGFGGRLIAVMAGMRNGRWQAAAGGEIRADALGQAGFYWELDPRSVNSLALENYALVGVAVDGPEARLLLAGRQDRGSVIDWEAAGRAVHELLMPQAEDARDMPQEEEPQRDMPMRMVDARAEDMGARKEETDERAAGDMRMRDDCCMELQPCEAVEAESAEPEQAECGMCDGDAPCGGEPECSVQGGCALDMTGGVQGMLHEDVRVGMAAGQPGAADGAVPNDWDTAECGCENSRRIRVLGATIAGEKDSELSDGELEQLIERTLRGMMAQLGKGGHARADTTGGERGSDVAEAGIMPQTQAGLAAGGMDAGMSADGGGCAGEERAVSELMAGQERAEADMNAREERSMADESNAPGMEVRREADEDDGMRVRRMEEDASGSDTGADSGGAAAGGDSALQGWLLEGVCDPMREWPDNCAELKPLFKIEAQVFPLEVPGFTFVRAPMADGGSCAVGVKCEDGRPSEVMYLIPGQRAAQPPAGLEGYVWREGAGGGFWAARQDAFTGCMLFDE